MINGRQGLPQEQQVTISQDLGRALRLPAATVEVVTVVDPVIIPERVVVAHISIFFSRRRLVQKRCKRQRDKETLMSGSRDTEL